MSIRITFHSLSIGGKNWKPKGTLGIWLAGVSYKPKDVQELLIEALRAGVIDEHIEQLIALDKCQGLTALRAYDIIEDAIRRDMDRRLVHEVYDKAMELGMDSRFMANFNIVC